MVHPGTLVLVRDLIGQLEHAVVAVLLDERGDLLVGHRHRRLRHRVGVADDFALGLGEPVRRLELTDLLEPVDVEAVQALQHGRHPDSGDTTAPPG